MIVRRAFALTILCLLPWSAVGQIYSQHSGTTNKLNSIDFWDAAEGWTVGDAGTVLHTIDSGKVWTPVNIGASQALNAVAIDYLDFRAVNVVGEGGKFYGTRDGINWYSSTLPGATNLNAVDFPTIDIGYAAGNSGALYRTVDSGHTWHKLTVPTTANLYGLYVYDEITLWAFGANGTALYSEDSGATWYNQNMSTTADLRAMSYGDDTTAWVVGNKVLIKTTDDATTFTTKSVPYNLTDVTALTADNAFAVGSGGTIYVTTDGTNWQLAPAVTTADLTSIVSPEADDLFISGTQGTILSTINPGSNSVAISPVLPKSVAYPNPASSTASIDLPEGHSSLRLFDALGRTIGTYAESGTLRLSVENLADGVYPYIVYTDGKSIATGRISVKH